jgi:hypothetical protein
MIKKIFLVFTLLLITILTSCGVIEDIFKAGYYVGIFIVLAVIILVFWLFSYLRKRR